MTHVLKVCVCLPALSPQRWDISARMHPCWQPLCFGTGQNIKDRLVTPGSWPLFADGNSGGTLNYPLSLPRFQIPVYGL